MRSSELDLTEQLSYLHRFKLLTHAIRDAANKRAKWKTLFAYRYAVLVLKAKYPEGEPAIARNGFFSYWYAKEALKGPFPLGEEAIANTNGHSDVAGNYCKLLGMYFEDEMKRWIAQHATDEDVLSMLERINKSKLV